MDQDTSMKKHKNSAEAKRYVKISNLESAEKFNPAMAIPDRPRHNNPIGLFGTGERYRVTFEDEEGLKYYSMISSDEQEDYITGMYGTITVDGDKVLSWSNDKKGKRVLMRLTKASCMLLIVIAIILICYFIGSSAEQEALSSILEIG